MFGPRKSGRGKETGSGRMFDCIYDFRITIGKSFNKLPDVLPGTVKARPA